MAVTDIDETRPLTPAQVAKLFGVDAKTVTRWAREGHLRSIRTPGGHRRYPPEDVNKLLAKGLVQS